MTDVVSEYYGALPSLAPGALPGATGGAEYNTDPRVGATTCGRLLGGIGVFRLRRVIAAGWS